MSGLFGSPKVPKSAPEVSSLRITTSCYGRPIPLGWGKYRSTAFLMYYNNFRTIPHTSQQDVGGKGGGQAVVNTTYTYQVAAIMGFGEVPANAATTLWKGKEYAPAAGTSSQTWTKTEYHLVPPSLQVTISPPGTFVATTSILALKATFKGGTRTITPAQYTKTGDTYTFTQSSTEGLMVQVTYTYTASAAPVSPVGNAGITFFKGDYTQTAWSYLSTNYPADAMGYRGICYGAASTYDLGGTPEFPNTAVELDSQFGFSSTIRDVVPADFLVDYLTNPYYGAYYTTQGLGDITNYRNYTIAAGLFLSPDYTEQVPASEVVGRTLAITNTGCTLLDKRLVFVPYADQAVTGNGVTWNPDLVAAYDLDMADFLPNGSEGPVKIRRIDPEKRYNKLSIKFRDRANQYNDAVVNAQDDAEISKNGLRPSPNDTDCPEVKDRGVAVRVSNLLLQRIINVGNTYNFKLKANKAALAPLSLVTITSPDQDLDHVLVRITKIAEMDADGSLDVDAEDVPVGAASAVLYPDEPTNGYARSANEIPNPVATPVLFEPDPVSAGGTGLAVWAAVTGQAGDDVWGGCYVHTSFDGETYQRVGTIVGGARYGQLTNSFGAGGTTIKVVLAGLGGQLLSGTLEEATNRATLCYMENGGDGEFFSHQGATLTAANAYDLTGCIRGQNNSVAAGSAAGADFVRIDQAVFRGDPLPVDYVGKTLWFKFQSFNVYGAGTMPLEDCTPYSYVVTGNQAKNLPGWAGKGVTLKSTGLVFQVNKAAVATPSFIDFEAKLTGGLTGSVTWAVVAGTATLSGSGSNQRRLNYASMTTDVVTIRAEIVTGVGTYFDLVTISKVREGADGSSQFTVTTTANMTFASGKATKVSGGGVWDGQVASQQGFKGGAGVSFSPAQSNRQLLVGLNADPTTSVAQNDIDFGFIFNTAATFNIRESGTNKIANTAYVAGDVFTILYDDVNVTYYQNGTQVFTTAAGPDLLLYLDSSFNGLGAVNNLVFYPVATGADAKLMQLVASSQVFQVSKTGVGSPATITFTANAQNLLGSPTFDVVAGTATLAGTGTARTLDYASMTTDTATIRVTQDSYSDEVTVVKVREGSDSITTVLTNEAVVLPADPNGNVTSFAGAETLMLVYLGAADDTNNWTFSFTASGVTASRVGNQLTITAMPSGTASGYVDFTASKAGYPSQTKRFSVAKSQQGGPGGAGANAQGLVLTNTADVFTFDADGNASPTSQTITFTANLQNIVGTVAWTCTLYDASGSSLGAGTLGGSGTTRTLTNASFGSAAYATVSASLSPYSDTCTVVRLRAGSNAVQSDLTNEAHTLPTDPVGNVLTYTGAETTMRVYIGIQEDSGNWAFSHAVSSGVSVSRTNNQVTVTGLTAGVTSGYVDITATRAGYPTQTKRFSLSTSKQGADGDDGANAQLLWTTATSQTFKFDGAGNASPSSQTITFTANLQNLAGTASWTCNLYDAAGNNISNPILGGSGNTRTLTNAQFGSAASGVITATLGSLSDYIRVVRVQDGGAGSNGTSPVASVLTNDSHTLPTDASGTITSYTGASTTMLVYLGSADDTSNWSYSVAASGGVSVSQSANTVTITGVTAGTLSGYVDITATRGGYPTQTKRFSLSTSKQGLPGGAGANASLMWVSSTAQTFKFDGNGNAVPSSQTITFTANLQNLAGTATWSCTLFDSGGNAISTPGLGGSGNTRTLTVAQFGSAAFANVSATLAPFSDTVTLVRLQDGAAGSNGSSPIVADLTNDSHTFPADSLGNVTSYTGATTTMLVYEGTADVSGAWTFSHVASGGVTVSRSGNVLSITGFTNAQNTGYVDFTATRSGYPTQTKRFTLAKALSAPGTSGPVVGWFAAASATDLTTPYFMNASIEVRTNGSLYRNLTPGGGALLQAVWYSPPTTGIGTTHWIRATLKDDGSTPPTAGPALGQWHQLTSDKVWANAGSLNRYSNLLISIATDSAGNNIVGSGEIQLDNANGE